LEEKNRNINTMNDSSYFIVAGIVFFASVLIIYIFRYGGKKKIAIPSALTDELMGEVLEQRVGFYRHLPADEQQTFLKRVRYFLEHTKISAEKGAVVTDEDKILIAASATIPLFHFKLWVYRNLTEVLVYPDYFDERFSTANEERNVAGMVGSGALNSKMILSQQALRNGFLNLSTGNTAIHEFVHLIDKADGEVDGVPEYLIPKSLIEPWIKEMHKTIREIRSGESDIREYAGTNEAEFFAVVSEYFFKKPALLKEDHPKLYRMLDHIYGVSDEP